MSQTNSFIERLKADIEWMKESIERYESGMADAGSVDSNGTMTSMKVEIVDHYRHTIESLQGIIDRDAEKSQS